MEEDTRNTSSGSKISIVNVYDRGNTVVYACSSNNGLYVSRDICKTWTNHSVTGDEGSIASNNIRDVYVGGPNGYICVATDKGVSISFDGNGAKWSNYTVNGNGDGVWRIAFGNGNIYAATKDNGLYILNTDGEVISHDYSDTCVNAICIGEDRSSDEAMLVYKSSGGDKDGIVRVSRDGGKKWKIIGKNIPVNNFAFFLGYAANSIYATCSSSSADHSLYNIVNDTMTAVLDVPPLGVATVACSSEDNVVYAGSSSDDAKVCVGHIHYDEDNNKQYIIWSTRQIEVPYSDKNIIAMAAVFEGLAYAVSGGNLYITTDSGKSWNIVNNF